MNKEFLFWLTQELRRLIAPLEAGLASQEAFAQLLRRHGWDVDPAAFDIADVRNTVGIADDLATVGQLLAEIVASGDDDVPLQSYLDLLEALTAIIGTIQGLTTRGSPAGLPQGLWAELTPALLDDLLVEYLAAYHPPVRGILAMFGVIEETPVAAGGAPDRVDYVKRHVVWARLGTALSDPVSVMRDAFGWGDPTRGPDLAVLLERLGALLTVFRVPAETHDPVPGILDHYYSSSHPDRTVRALHVPLARAEDPNGNSLTFDLVLLPIPPPPYPQTQASQRVDGFALWPSLKATGAQLAESMMPFTLELGGEFATDGGIRVELRPGAIRAVPAAAGTTTVDAQVMAVDTATYPRVLLGTKFSHRVELWTYAVRLHLHGSLDDPTIELAIAFDEVHLVLDVGDADSFIGKLLGGKSQIVEFGLALVWSSRTGLHVEGRATLEVEFPINKALGPIEFRSLHLTVGLGGTGIDLGLGLDLAATLGPVAATVTNIGTALAITSAPEGQTGVFGGLDLVFRFKPPDGIGIVIDAGPVTGGGFLEIDHANARYAGILQLQAAGFAITAIGLLDTRLPGGVPGYSFLIIITVKFSPIQLGFGFALTGIGGLAGINRALVTEALQAGVRSGTVDRILFPTNPVKDAPRIISDLRTIFPPAAGRYVFGPMVSLVWGNSIIEAELGIIITLPAPIVIVLLGQINLTLPTKKDTIVELHIDIVGVLDFGSKRLEIDASLHDSRVLVFSLYGDMALRLSWGERPEFAVSIGGLHPLFQPPPRFPQLRRLTLALGSGENPRLTLQTYLAVTSNSFQIGARAELYAESGGFNLAGWIGFDALFYFSPFEFRADFTAGIALRRGDTELATVQLDAHLTGPAPWHVWGEASLTILVFHVTVPFDRTFGEEQRVDALPGDPWEALDEAVKDPRSWSATPPEGSTRAVSVTGPEQATAPALVDPLGGLTLRQRAVPLHRTLTKFGEGALPAAVRFDVDSVAVGTQPASSVALVREPFAPGPFEELSEADKLTRASFEEMDAGMSIGATAVAFGSAADVKGVDAEYETVQVDAKGTQGTPLGVHTVSQEQLLSVLHGGAVAHAGLATTGPRRFAPPAGSPTRVQLGEEGYLVAATADLKVRTDVLAEPTTRGAAEHALAAWLQGRPTDRGLVEVVPEHEAVPG